MSVKRISASAVNWARLAQHTPPEQMDAMRSIRAKNDTLVTRVNTLPSELPAIDWARFSKTVPTAGLVDKFRKEYEALKVPYPRDSEGWHDLINAQQKHQGELQAKTISLLNGVRDAAKAYVQTLDEKVPAREEWTWETATLYFPESTFNPDKPDINSMPDFPSQKEAPNVNRHPGGGLLSKL